MMGAGAGAGGRGGFTGMNPMGNMGAMGAMGMGAMGTMGMGGMMNMGGGMGMGMNMNPSGGGGRGRGGWNGGMNGMGGQNMQGNGNKKPRVEWVSESVSVNRWIVPEGYSQPHLDAALCQYTTRRRKLWTMRVLVISSFSSILRLHGCFFFFHTLQICQTSSAAYRNLLFSISLFSTQCSDLLSPPSNFPDLPMNSPLLSTVEPPGKSAGRIREESSQVVCFVKHIRHCFTEGKVGTWGKYLVLYTYAREEKGAFWRQEQKRHT
jgi:hypothetical protein